MRRKWWEETPLEELEERRRSLEESLAGPTRRYKPGMYSRGEPSHMGIYQEFLKEVEEEGDEEEVLNKYVRKLLARGGWKRDEARKRLLGTLLRERLGGQE